MNIRTQIIVIVVVVIAIAALVNMIRKHTLEFDDVMNRQRSVIYDFRSKLLQADSIREDSLQFLDDAAGNLVDDFCNLTINREVNDEEIKEFMAKVLTVFPVNLNFDDVKKFTKEKENLENYLVAAVHSAFTRKIEIEGPENMERLEKYVFLITIDKFWKEHLYNMDGVRESVYLRSYGQKDPLLEYKREAHAVFAEMMENMAGEIANLLFSLTTVPEKVAKLHDMNRATYSYEDVSQNNSNALSQGNMNLSMNDAAYSGAGGAIKQKTVRNDGPKVGRNDDCPCGSGKKYKKCCGS